MKITYSTNIYNLAMWLVLDAPEFKALPVDDVRLRADELAKDIQQAIESYFYALKQPAVVSGKPRPQGLPIPRASR